MALRRRTSRRSLIGIDAVLSTTRMFVKMKICVAFEIVMALHVRRERIVRIETERERGFAAWRVEMRRAPRRGGWCLGRVVAGMRVVGMHGLQLDRGAAWRTRGGMRETVRLKFATDSMRKFQYRRAAQCRRSYVLAIESCK